MNFEEIITIHVKIKETIKLDNEFGDSVVMIPFTGKAEGKYFNGNVLDGGIDTQIISKSGDHHSLSARYMLEGTDYKGENCRIFIENNGNIKNSNDDTPKNQMSNDQDKNAQSKNCVIFKTYPKIVTDSKALAFLNNDLFVGEGLLAEGGVDIKIYRAT